MMGLKSHNETRRLSQDRRLKKASRRTLPGSGHPFKGRLIPSVTDQGAKRSACGSWYAFLLLRFLYALSLMDGQIIALMVNPLQLDFGLSDVQVGLLEGFEAGDKLFGSLGNLCSLRAHFVKA